MAPTRRSIAVAIALAVWLSAPAGPVRAATSPPVGSWVWPIDGSVVRGFEPPSTPYSPGHRGIDIAAPFGTPVVAPADGLVSFAGPVGGSLFVSIDHPDGYRSTSAYLSQVLVRKGQSVRAGQVVAMSGRGHPDIPYPQLHFGVRRDGVYVDPIPLLQPQSVVDIVRLVPLGAGPARGPPSSTHTMSSLWPLSTRNAPIDSCGAP